MNAALLVDSQVQPRRQGQTWTRTDPSARRLISA